MNSIIEVKNLSKKYNIIHQQGGYIAMRDVLTNIAKHPFKFLKKKTKKAIGKETKEEFWALKNINFEIKKGEAIGIIGSNGAGKSTLLKILSKITPPTTGTIKYRGTISSLLEVGTGFHPELTGRENIFLNGAILGMAKKEIAKKFDNIVEFAGIGKFLDTPVKRYSSGMYVRLAFAVAAHMEPDILVVDEVLAVGDAEFQKKCLGKMDEVTKEAGRTILFVSHNMSAIQNLCKRCILLENGEIKMIGETKEVVGRYLEEKINNDNIYKYKYNPKNDLLVNNYVELISATLTDDEGGLCKEFNATDNINVKIKYKIKKEPETLFIDVYLYNENGIYILHTNNNDKGNLNKSKKEGVYIDQCKIPKNLLNIGKYSITLGARIPNVKQFFSVKNALTFQINSICIPTNFDSPRAGIICPILEWDTSSL